MILIFLNNLQVSLGMMPFSILLNKVPHEEMIRKWEEAAKQFFKEEQDLEGSQTPLPCSTKTEHPKLSSLEIPTFKCRAKQGPVKSSKKLKLKTKDDDK